MNPSQVWQSFFDAILQGQFYVHESESMLDGYFVEVKAVMYRDVVCIYIYVL